MFLNGWRGNRIVVFYGLWLGIFLRIRLYFFYYEFGIRKFFKDGYEFSVYEMKFIFKVVKIKFLIFENRFG